MEKTKRLIVLSLDAVGARDMAEMEQLPNFRRLMERGAACKKVTSVYPSLTYPAHTSIVTGRYPDNHGIVNNVRFQPGRAKPDWFWQRKYIAGTTLYEEAAKKGMKVSALLWPVTGKAKAITWNLPEVLPNRPWENQILVSSVNGTALYELELLRKFGHMRDGIKQPQLDDFIHASMLYTLKKYRPDLMLVHLTDVDTARHAYGVNGDEVLLALKRHDRRLGELCDTLEQMGWSDSVNVVVLGDHCQMDTHHVLYPNFFFRERGYLDIKNGRISDWTMLARDCDGSCYVYLKNRDLYREAAVQLKEMKKLLPGIAGIRTGKQAKVLGADSRCAFMLEAKPGYYFQNGWEKALEEVKPGMFFEDGHLQAATHGYLPSIPGYETFFAAAGPDFRSGARVESMSLVDEGPTLAQILGVTLGETDGKVIRELIREK